jgi:hypothetical protein
MRWAVLAMLATMDACTPMACRVHYRDDGIATPGHRRYYAVQVCEKVLCDSATRLPDPATMTGGCR